MNNPFLYGNPVSSEQFIGRRREIRHIVGRILNQGQSTALIGEPRCGKTSLLLYLSAPEKRAELYGDDGEKLLFKYLDAQMLGGSFSQAEFWEQALAPFYESVVKSAPTSHLIKAYRTCKGNDFGAFVLERLLAQMRSEGWRLILLLDEFDALLHNPVLNSVEFFGGLRSLASRGQGALALVLATRKPLDALNVTTQEFSRGGSPYFNFLDEIVLGPLAQKDAEVLLRRAEEHFSAGDRRFILDVSGAHPYLLQVAASAMWGAYEDRLADEQERWETVGEFAREKAAAVLSDTWKLWHPLVRLSFMIVALTEMSSRDRHFHEPRLLRRLEDLGPELKMLEKYGFVAQDPEAKSGWRVRTQAFLWWLGDELVRSVRGESDFAGLLRREEWDGLLTRGERQQLSKAVRSAVEILKDNAKTLIEAGMKIF